MTLSLPNTLIWHQKNLFHQWNTAADINWILIRLIYLVNNCVIMLFFSGASQLFLQWNMLQAANIPPAWGPLMYRSHLGTMSG